MKPLSLLASVLLVVPPAVGAAQAVEQPGRSRLCPEDLPEGVRLPPQPGCAGPTGKPATRRDGVYDLGNGTTLQVGGRSSAEYGVRR